MRSRRPFASVVIPVCCLFFVNITPLRAEPAPAQEPRNASQVLASAIHRWVDLIEPPAGTPAKTFVAKMKLTQADGLPAEVAGATARIAFEAPARLKISATVAGSNYSAGRDGNHIWIYEPGKKFAVLGKPGVARFRAEPDSIDMSVVPPFSLPMSRRDLLLAPLLVQATLDTAEKIDGAQCQVLRLRLMPAAAEMLHVTIGEVDLWVRDADQLPARIVYSDGKKTHVQIDFTEVKLTDPLSAEEWKLHAAADDKVETVAVSHLVKFIGLVPQMLTDKAPTLPPATGERHLVATEGKGRLEMIDGTRVLFLKGSPEEMGLQHGVLLKKEIHRVCDRILYGVGVGSSFERGSWFFGEIEGAEARLEHFMDRRYLAEEDAIARGAGMDVQEARLSNFFPELFHCSGFAVFGKATKDGHIYHGRVLDYLRGVGLEQSAVVIVHQPDYGNAWVNLSYAGFVGSITAMNEKGISIGEMGGKGYGDWDGRPMAHIMREVMEKASTLDEAIKIMRDAPRTCQYYYVIADGKAHTAVGIAATPSEFVTIKPGEYHPLLATPEPDTVMLSAGRRYETLAGRVKENYGTFDADSARKLMDPPVCMDSNIQSVLFEPDTLDLWVANADAKNVASLTRYTHYNLRELLNSATGK